jgi:DNA-binding NtrC family response regulator
LLLIDPAAEEQRAVRRILEGSGWNLEIAASCREAMEQLCGRSVSAILCESVLEDGTWRDILNCIAGDRDAPRLIVTSRLADASLWAEVLNLGGYDVLAKPLDTIEVSHLLKSVSLRG